jgi:hypothetical protein
MRIRILPVQIFLFAICATLAPAQMAPFSARDPLQYNQDDCRELKHVTTCARLVDCEQTKPGAYAWRPRPAPNVRCLFCTSRERHFAHGFPGARVYSGPMRQKGYWIDIVLLAGIVICLVLIALRYLQGLIPDVPCTILHDGY